MSSAFTTFPSKATKQPTPFKVSIPQSEIDDFKTLLKVSKVAAPTYESLQEDRRYGVTHKWISEAKKVWEGSYDWRKCESYINSFPNYTTNVKVDKLDHKIHFVALFSENPDAIPVVLLHGWPGNFMEFLPILSLMKEKYTPKTLPYHLIIPSLPGYTFSSRPPLDQNFTVADIAAIVNQLMFDLGFESGYIAQGGDIGSRVARVLGSIHPACKAIHLNFFILKEFPEEEASTGLTAAEEEGVKRGKEFINKGSGYALEHATRPATIGLVLGANPISLLAWLGEKYLEWTDEDPSLEEILDMVTLYWLTETFPTSIYTYRGRFAPGTQPGMGYIKTPTGYSKFPKELVPTPKSWVEKEANVVFYREHTSGGHFAAKEKPELLMADLEEFVKQVWVN